MNSHNDQRKLVVIGLIVLSIFIFLIAALVFVYALYSTGEKVPSFLEPFLTYHIHFMIIMGLFGMGSGLIVYKMLTSTIEEEKKIVSANMGIIMKFLSHDEGAIVELLKSTEGMTTQSEIARLPGMSRLRAHRAVKKLEKRGIIYIEKYGKVNMVRLVEELKAV